MIPTPERVSEGRACWYVWFAVPSAVQLPMYRGIVAQRDLHLMEVSK